MKKKTLIIGLASLLGLVAIAATYFLLFQKKELTIKDTVKVIPQSAGFLIEIRDFDSFNNDFINDNSIFETLKNLPAFELVNNYFENIDSIIQKHGLAKQFLNSNPLLASAHVSGKDNLNWFFAIALPLDSDGKSAISLMKNIFADSTSCSERKYENETIYELKYNIGKRTLSFAVYGKILMWSHSGLLIEEAINQLKLKTKSLADEDDFVEVYKTAGQKEIANIYLNTNKISAPLMTNLNSEANGLSNIIKQFGTWVEFDFEQKNDLINLSGYTYVNDSVASLAGLINSQDLTTSSIETILPTNTVFYLRMAFTDANTFVEKMEAYNASLGFGEKIKSELNQFNEKYNTDLRKTIYPLIDSEIGRASLVKQEDCNKYENFLIVKTKSQTNAETEIKNICENIASAKGKTLSDFIKVFKIDEGKSFNIYTLNSNDWGVLLFGPVFAGIETNYLCFYDNYMIMGESFQSLSNFIKMQVLNKVLSTDIKHSSFMSKFSKKSNLFVFFDLSRSKALLSSFLGTSAKENFEAAFKEISKIRNFAFQFSANEGLVFNYAIVKYDPEQREEPQTVWASNLDASVFSKPAIVVNHDTKAKEIIVQDENNILHLLSESGRELWKIPIDGKILGDIQQVDAFKNAKLQYFFTTETHLHLIDRLGNYVDRYPIPLRENTKIAASVFDYDNDKNYRIIVPSEDKNVYLYDIEGKIVKGWNFAKTDNQVLQPISFYRSAGSDYIFFNDKFKVYVVNRRGEPRLELNTNFEFSKNNSVIFDAANNIKPDRLIASSSSGTVYFMNFNGDIDSLNIGEYSENHYFAAYDIDNNGTKELIFVDNGIIDVYKQDKNKLFSINFETQITDAPNFYRFSVNQVKIGLVSKNKETIYLLNNDGTMFEGFPLKGSSAFSIGYVNNLQGFFNLFCGGSENYLYNYQISER